MSLMRFNFRKGLLSLLIMAPLPLAAEQYVTWTDENGNVRVQKLEADQQPALPLTLDTKDEGVSETEAEIGQEAVETGTGAEAAPEPSKGSPTADKAATTEGVGRLSQSPPVEDPDSYIDAAELEARGFQRQGNARFYTWVDEQGNVQSTLLRDDAAAGSVTQAFSTPAPSGRILAREERMHEDAELPDSADPRALAMLGIGADGQPDAGMTETGLRQIDRIARRCCDDLRKFAIDELRFDDSLLIEFSDQDARHDFGLGISNYRLIRLPENVQAGTRVKLESFIRGEMVNPSVVLLDSELRPVRLLTEILYAYSPGNWYRHASLTGFLRIESQEKEPYLLVFNRRDDRESATVIEGLDEGREIIRHGLVGEVFLEILKEEG